MLDTPELRAVQLHQAANAVRAYPGHTLDELASAIAVDCDLLHDRLLELEADGKVYRPPHALNRCRVTGKLAAPWYPGCDPDAVPSDLVRSYANALDAMTVPVDPRQEELLP